MTTTHENELFLPVDLCDSHGNLNPAAVGWSRTPLHRCNLAGHPLRKKYWNYWCITSRNHLFSITLSNVSYMGLAFAYFLDFESKEYIEQTVMTPFGRGLSMPTGVYQPVSFAHPQMKVDIQDTGTAVDIQAESPIFQSSPMTANFHILRPAGHETLNVVIPWSKDRFQYTSKQECLPAEGSVNIGGRSVDFPGGESFACLDFGRGIWKYASSWNWGAFSGKSGTHTVGVNLGDKWTTGTGYTENGIVLDGKLIKIGEEVQFEYDSNDFMKPWRMRTRKSDLLNLLFTPFYERVAKTDFLILKSEVHQMIGHYDGEVRDEQGTIFRIERVPGWAEEHHARW
jgi:hypothetical protein